MRGHSPHKTIPCCNCPGADGGHKETDTALLGSQSSCLARWSHEHIEFYSTWNLNNRSWKLTLQSELPASHPTVTRIFQWGAIESHASSRKVRVLRQGILSRGDRPLLYDKLAISNTYSHAKNYKDPCSKTWSKGTLPEVGVSAVAILGGGWLQSPASDGPPWWCVETFLLECTKHYLHTETRAYTSRPIYIYLYLYACLCVCLCRNKLSSECWTVLWTKKIIMWNAVYVYQHVFIDAVLELHCRSQSCKFDIRDPLECVYRSRHFTTVPCGLRRMATSSQQHPTKMPGYWKAPD